MARSRELFPAPLGPTISSRMPRDSVRSRSRQISCVPRGTRSVRPVTVSTAAISGSAPEANASRVSSGFSSRTIASTGTSLAIGFVVIDSGESGGSTSRRRSPGVSSSSPPRRCVVRPVSRTPPPEAEDTGDSSAIKLLRFGLRSPPRSRASRRTARRSVSAASPLMSENRLTMVERAVCRVEGRDNASVYGMMRNRIQGGDEREDQVIYEECAMRTGFKRL